MRVSKTIDRYAMFAADDKVLVGVSGGPDSVALLQILRTLAAHYRIELAVAHLDHGLRPEAAKLEADQVIRTAAEMKLACHVDHIELDHAAGSLEERARKERYAFFNRLVERFGYTRIALGHHVDDNAEAVLMHLLRGSGIRGLAGIPPVRDGRIVRPLIHVRRAEILDYLHQRNLTYARDASNDDLRYERNRIRHELIPLLEKHYNPNIVNTLNRTADLCWEEDQWLHSHLAEQVDRLVAEQLPSMLKLRVDPLASVPLAMRRRLIRDALHRWQGTLRRIGAEHIDAILSMLHPERQAKQISLPNQLQVRRTANHLHFFPERRWKGQEKSAHPAFHHVIESVDRLPVTIDIPEACGSLCLERSDGDKTRPLDVAPHTEQFDIDNLAFPIVIRNFRPGDRLQPFGMHGTRKVKRLFGDRKIPARARMRIPLLLSGDQIIWVAGLRRGRAAPITPATTRVLTARWHSPAPNRRTDSRLGRREPDKA